MKGKCYLTTLQELSANLVYFNNTRTSRLAYEKIIKVDIWMIPF